MSCDAFSRCWDSCVHLHQKQTHGVLIGGFLVGNCWRLLEVCLGFLWILLRCFHILFFWNIIGWSLHLAWEPNELPGGMIRVWRLMIKWTGTIMNYLWDASTSVECTRMAKRQAISFSRSLILSNSPPGYSSMVFQCCPVPISETGRILWDVFYKTGSLKGVLFLSRSFRSNRPSSTVPFGPSENPSPRHAGCGKQDGAHHLCWYLDFC